MTAPPSSPSGAFPMQAKTPHGRTRIGLGMMVVGIVFAVPQLLTQVLDAIHQNPEAVSPTTLQLARWYGLPALLILSGYNMIAPQSFAALVDRVRSVLPGKS